MAQLRKLKHACSLLLVAALCPALASAEELAGLSIHGAGGVAFGETDGPNSYLSGTPDPSYDLRDFTLTVLATPSDRLLVGAQVHWGVGDIFTRGTENVDLVQAFAQYKVSDALKVRAGALRQPFGLYSETLEIGTLRPFLNLPRGVYSPGTFQWDQYRGVGLTGALGQGSRWQVDYDLYGGGLESSNSGANPIFTTLGSGSTGQVLRDLIGARLRLRPPVDGLMVGAAFYSGTPETPLLRLPIVRQDAYLGSLEILREHWQVRSEYGHRDAGNGAKGDAAYVETAVRPGQHWELAARWDWFHADLGPLIPLPSFLSTILDHRDVAFGVNYRVTDGFTFMASIHKVKGNFFAAPLDGVDFAHGGTLDPDTRLIQCGAQFSF